MNRQSWALVEGMAAARANTPGPAGGGTASYPAEGLQTVTDEDIALLRQDIPAKKMQVIGQNMSRSNTEAERFRTIYQLTRTTCMK